MFARCLRTSRSGSSWSRLPSWRYPISSPSIRTCPRSTFSRWLMVRGRVDLPEPDGPRITVTLPLPMVRSMPLSTSCDPNDLWTPLVAGGTAGDALRRTLDLARHAEQFGYHRYWVAEHHLTPGVASSQPALLLGQIAAVTDRIRLGSGAVQTGFLTPLG